MMRGSNLFRPAIGRVTGLGSAKGGTHHWWMQRLTAIALVPLTIWFVATVAALAGTDHAGFTAALSSPLTALLMILFVGTGFYHLKLGLQVVIEDYVHTKPVEIALLILNSFGCIILGGLCILSILKITFGG